MSLAVTPKAASAHCRQIDSGLVAMASITGALAFSVSNPAESWSGSGTATATRVPFAVDTADLSAGEFAVGRGMSFCGRSAVLQAPAVGSMGDGTVSGTYTHTGDPPDVSSGALTFDVGMYAHPTDASLVIVELNVTGMNAVTDIDDSQATLQIEADRYTLTELIGTHVVTLDVSSLLVGGSGSGTFTWTIA